MVPWMTDPEAVDPPCSCAAALGFAGTLQSVKNKPKDKYKTSKVISYNRLLCVKIFFWHYLCSFFGKTNTNKEYVLNYYY